MPSRPPASVVLVAQAHGAVGVAAAAAGGLAHLFTLAAPIEFGSRAYVFAGAMAALYLGTAALVWGGGRGGPALSRLCALLYVIRPRFCGLVFDLMRTEEFRAHFARPRSPRNPEQPRR